MNKLNSISRRGFLRCAALFGGGVLASGALIPSDAKASEDAVYIKNPEVDRLWADALRRSEDEAANQATTASVEAAYAFVAAYGECTVSFLQEKVALYASLEVASNNVITQLYGWNLTTVYGLYSVANCIPGGEVILDGGRTRAIHFTVHLVTVTGQTQIRDGYAEIYYTGAVYLVV